MKRISFILLFAFTSAICDARTINAQPYYEYMDTFDMCVAVDSCLHFPNDSSKFLNGKGNWVTFTDSGALSQPYKYIAYGDSTNHITGDSLFTRDPLDQTIILRNIGTASTGFIDDTALYPLSSNFPFGVPGTQIFWYDSIIKTFAGINIYRDPANVPYPGLMINAGDASSNNSVNSFYHIDDTATGGVRDWRINNTAYNGTNQTRSMCNLGSNEGGDVHAEMESSSDVTNEKSNIGLWVNRLTISHELDADSIYLGCTVDTSGFSFWNSGRSGMGIGGYHFPLYHGSNGQSLTDNGTGQLYWGSSNTFQPFTQIAYGDSTNHITGDSLFTRDQLGQTTILRNIGTASTGFIDDTALSPLSSSYGFGVPGTSIFWYDSVVKTIAGIDIFRDPSNEPYPSLMIMAGDTQGNSINTLYHVDDITAGVRNWRVNNTAYNGTNQSRVQCDLASNYSSLGDVFAQIQASNDTSNESAGVNLSVHQLSLGYTAPSTSTSINSVSCTLDSNGLGFSNNTLGSGYYFPKSHGNAGQVITDDGSGNLSFTFSGVLGGSFDLDTTASILTVTLPTTLPSSTYKVVITASNSFTAGNNYWVDTKTTNSFNINFTASHTGEFKFDWILTP
jgi:hypothetical protein